MNAARMVRLIAVSVPAVLAMARIAQGTGACCLCDGSCEITTEVLCDIAGGIYQGDGTACGEVTCGEFGACCFPDDLSCLNGLTAAECVSANGYWQGACTDCGEVACPLTGACCFSDGSCMRLTHDECVSQGGQYQGFSTECETTSCWGACCFDDGECLADMTRDDCEADLNGLYQGHGTACDSANCPALVQVATYSVEQGANPPFVILEFAKFDDWGGLRVLERVVVKLDAAVYLKLAVRNVGDTPMNTEMGVSQYVAVSDFPVLTPPPLVAVDVFEWIHCDEDPLPPGESCDFGGLLSWYGSATDFLDQDDDLSPFIGSGVFQAAIESSSELQALWEEYELSVTVHVGEGTLTVVYEYTLDPCPADLDHDGFINVPDLLQLLGAWGTPDGDVDGDGDTDTADLLALLAAWGECP